MYIYGSLDFSPTIIDRKFGLAWSVGGYLLTNALARLGGEAIGRMRARVLAEAKTTFASGYAQTIGLRDVLQPEILARVRAPQHRNEVPDRPIERPLNLNNGRPTPQQQEFRDQYIAVPGSRAESAPVAGNSKRLRRDALRHSRHIASRIHAGRADAIASATPRSSRSPTLREC